MPLIQRKAGEREADSEVGTRLNALKVDGRPLPDSVRKFFEPRFRYDFSGVRVHSDSRSAESARSINASAFTFGSDVVFGAGQYKPETREGRSLLAHELTHVVQQMAGLARSGGMISRIADRSAVSPALRLKSQNKSEPSDDPFESSVGGLGTQEREGSGGNPPEAVCPPVPTKLADVPPDPPCPKATHTGATELARFNFCPDSDELSFPEELGQVSELVKRKHPKTRFLLRGYSSIEGNSAYNFRLACYRANRIAATFVTVIADRVRRRMLSRQPTPDSERIEEEVQSEIESRVETATQGPTSEFGTPEANRVVVVFGQIPGGQAPEEPSCEDAPRKIGDIKPEISCDVATVDLRGKEDGPGSKQFLFCLDSDVLAGVQPSAIRNFAHKQAAKATFVVHGFSSVVGAPDYNQRLSCHRALRVFRELMNAGVRPEQIREVSGLGETTSFGNSDAENQVAVVLVEGGEADPLKGGRRKADTRAEKLAVRDEARERLISGQYNLAADAYISFWTCGRTATVRQAVERLTIEVQQGNRDETLRDAANGVEEGFGVNFVRLSNLALRADNAIECTMGRLIDMAFHHAVLGNPDLPADLLTPFDPEAKPKDPIRDPKNKEARHKAGLHLIHLAGLSACAGEARATDGPGREPAGIDEPLINDPRKGAPGCAEAPQPTRLLPRAKGAKERETPEFKTIGTPSYTPATGKLATNLDPKERITSENLITKPDKAILTATANVQLIGNRDVFADYEVGFIQAVLSDETEVEYSSGHHLIQQLPVPIRLAAMKGDAPVPAPWTTMTAVSRHHPDGKVSVSATGSGLNSEAALGLRPLKSTLPKSAIVNFEHSSHIAIWLIARRIGAPLDRFSVRFLDGAQYDLVQVCHREHRRKKGTLGEPDVVGGEHELAIFVGGFHASKPSLLPADSELARLGGPVSADIGLFNQIKRIIEPGRATEAGLGKQELTEVVRDILDNLVLFETEDEAKKGAPGTKMPRLGFDFIPLTITLPIVRTTGRLVNPEVRRIVTKVEGPGLGGFAAQHLAEALELRIRDRSFQGRDVVVRPSLVSGTEAEGDVTVLLPPLKRQADAPKEQESDLVKNPKVLEHMAEAWACTEFTGKPENVRCGAREFGLTYSMDRDKQLHTDPTDHIVMGEEEKDGTFETKLPCPRPSDAVTLGSFHTHPETQISPKPSEADLEYAKGCGPCLKGEKPPCGAQHYIVTANKVFRYFPDGTVTAIDVSLPKGQCHKVTVEEFLKCLRE